MAGRVMDMAKTHIVYTFYQEEFADRSFFKAHKVNKVPVILVFVNGKPVARHVGVVET